MGIASGYPRFIGTTGEFVVVDDQARVDRRYVAEWVSKTTNASDTALAVLADATYPSLGDSYDIGNDQDDYAFCRRLYARQPNAQNDPTDWRVRAEYGRLGLPPDEPASPTAPWTRLNRWRIEQADYTELCTTDRNGDAVKNKAGQRYDPPPEKDAANTIIEVTYYKQSLKLSTLDTYRFAINSLTFWGYAAEKLRINQLTAEEQYESGLYYWQIFCQIEAKAAGWDKKALEEGMLIKNGSDWEVPKDSDDVKLAIPVLLKSDGTMAATTDTPLFTNWEVYETENFSSSDLGLPSLPSHLSYS